MPQGPGTYGSRVGRPKLKRKKKIKESIYTRTKVLLEIALKQDRPAPLQSNTRTPVNPDPHKASDRRVLRAAKVAAQNAGTISAVGTATKWGSRALDVAGLASGGLATGAKKIIVKAGAYGVRKALGGSVKDWAKERVAKAAGREAFRGPVGRVLRRAITPGGGGEGEPQAPDTALAAGGAGGGGAPATLTATSPVKSRLRRREPRNRPKGDRGEQGQR